MRLTVELWGHTLTLALECDEDSEPQPQHGDLAATTERAEAFDFDHSPVGFITSKGRP